ncbi:MAG: GntR family transcriptional regulator [Gaiellaceae bacterium MAG52_C11]|nr:GntR family transcriptional regulator [Candidatus Gaiellasilicea maunaloa]
MSEPAPPKPSSLTLKRRRLTPLRQPPTLASQAADVIREQILAGRWASAERLVETTLARELGVSRGPIREAFAQLTAEGLVASGPRIGVTVSRLDPEDVSDLYDLRIALETACARSIVENVEYLARDFALLDKSLTRMERAAVDEDASEIVRADLRIHAEICRMSGNGRIHEAFLHHAGILERILRLDALHGDSNVAIVDEHRAIVDALRLASHDCEAIITQHLLDAKQRIVSRLQV